MRKYIALLRGINISGQKIIKMADLRSYLTDIGLKNVQTYIQSGNIIFESNDSIKNLTQLIIDTIEKHYGFYVPTFILSPEQLQDAVNNNSYPNAEGNRLYLTFLSEEANLTGMEAIEEKLHETEYLSLIDNIIYFHCPNGAARSKITNNLIEKKLEVRATTRNWRTCNKLLALTTQQ
jgi:uncharacterized protein (DUF1697 family)